MLCGNLFIFKKDLFFLVDYYRVRFGKVLESLGESMINEWVFKESIKVFSIMIVFF